jgi:hypothetical protein
MTNYFAGFFAITSSGQDAKRYGLHEGDPCDWVFIIFESLAALSLIRQLHTEYMQRAL